MPQVFGFPSDPEAISSTQRQILAEAAHTLGKGGVGGLEAKKVAIKLGISPSLINHYYSSIEELTFDAVLYSYADLVGGMRASALASRDPEWTVRMWIEGMLDWLQEYPGLGVILEFPRQVMRTGGRQPDHPEQMLAHFTKEMSKISADNVAVMASAVRALQTGGEMKLLSALKIAALFKVDAAFAAYTSLMGFATIGAGLWIAGRRPGERGVPLWRQLGFNPTRQARQTTDHLIAMIRLNSVPAEPSPAP